MENCGASSPKGQGSTPGWIEPGKKKPCSLDQTGCCVLPPGTQGTSYLGSWLLFLPTSSLFSTLQPDQYTKNTDLVVPLLKMIPTALQMGSSHLRVAYRPVPALATATSSCVHLDS